MWEGRRPVQGAQVREGKEVVKLVKAVLEGCPCRSRILELEAARRRDDLPPLWIGSVVECECGRVYRLVDDFTYGSWWEEVKPNERRGRAV